MSRVWFLTIDKNLNDIFVFKLALKRFSFESWAVTEIDTHAGKNQNEYSRFAGEHIATIHHQPELNSCFTTSCRLTYWILFNIIQWLQHSFTRNVTSLLLSLNWYRIFVSCFRGWKNLIVRWMPASHARISLKRVIDRRKIPMVTVTKITFLALLAILIHSLTKEYFIDVSGMLSNWPQ